jgi:phosphopantothenoylcysteine decarboxylase/phosphopantothenate--cysteine ligase
MQSSFNPLAGKTIVLGISGGIAAYKSCDIASRLRQAGADVHAVMTSNAKEFVTPLSLQTLTRNPVHCEQFGKLDNWRPEHIDLAREADLLVIAPATADIIAKLAVGMCDDLLCTMVLAATVPVMIAPAMNPVMWEHPATENNVSTLQDKYRYTIIPPDIGEVACGEWGTGKMASVDTIVATIVSRLVTQKNLLGKHIVVTAGGTREPIDPVRFIGNRSSGKMGIAVADAATARGASVTLISTVPIDRPYPVIEVETAFEMQEAVEAEFDTCDALIMTAAVADFRPLSVSGQKIKKTDSDDLTLELTKNPDILDLLGRVKRDNQIVIGFAAESEQLLTNASQKLKRKNIDMIVANDITVPDLGFGSDENAVIILDSEGKRENLARMPKRAIAEHLCDLLCERFAQKQTPTTAA